MLYNYSYVKNLSLIDTDIVHFHHTAGECRVDRSAEIPAHRYVHDEEEILGAKMTENEIAKIVVDSEY